MAPKKEKGFITKEEIKKIMATKGETRGFNLKDDTQYILQKKDRSS